MIHWDILQYSTQFTENVKTAETQVAVYDLGSVNIFPSHYIDNSADKLSQNNIFFLIYLNRIVKLQNTLM